ncbi:unnamed protein product [Chondrus crispus]|uniref:Uncharacterized protein n=1 Tax=Chondrus crispus TaxID=2769 RepID=R7QJA9_CHOCR|nr:unnamed protein product [Chondrus crispus]CDF38602.1 unnamed protein product [Chondrus crispus]|eukprot:XP_005718507.1 unnamed protein product [Chondrus crispus]
MHYCRSIIDPQSRPQSVGPEEHLYRTSSTSQRILDIETKSVAVSSPRSHCVTITNTVNRASDRRTSQDVHRRNSSSDHDPSAR